MNDFQFDFMYACSFPSESKLESKFESELESELESKLELIPTPIQYNVKPMTQINNKLQKPQVVDTTNIKAVAITLGAIVKNCHMIPHNFVLRPKFFQSPYLDQQKSLLKKAAPLNERDNSEVKIESS